MDIDFRYKYVIHRDGYMEWAIKLRNVIALGFFVMAVPITRAEYCGCLQQMNTCITYDHEFVIHLMLTYSRVEILERDNSIGGNIGVTVSVSIRLCVG
jgi:hypothetical protein